MKNNHLKKLFYIFVFALHFFVTTLSANTISGGDNFSVWIEPNGTLWAWGDNNSGQLGDGTITPKLVPTQIGSDTNWKSITTGSVHAVAIKHDGTLWTWGDNESGQLGDGTITAKLVPTQIGTDTNWKSINAGYYYTVAIKSDGTLWTWGDNYYGQLGDGTTNYKSIPTQIGSDTSWSNIAAGSSHTVAIKTNGTLWAWGNNENKELGDGTNISKSIPTQIGSDTSWSSITVGYDYTVAIKSNGTLWGWGANWSGQLGDGTTDSKSVPTQMGNDTHWLSITAGDWHTIAIKTDETLWSWGNNNYGQLGDGTTNDKSIPTQIGSDINWSSIDAGHSHALALKNNGTSISLYTWGKNDYGQLGNGTTTTTNKNFPTQIGTNTFWKSVTAGVYHTVAIKNDGTLWAWGYNYYGQLGDGTTTTKYLPTQIGTDTSWKSVTTGVYHTVAIKNDGTLWAWGNNYYGELGDGTTTNKNVPTQIGIDTSWESVTAGYFHTVAIKNNGILWAWGNNSYGELGDGTTTNKNVPTQIGTDSSWKSVTAGVYHTVAIKNDGTLWACGYNAYGQLGDGTTTTKYLPTQIETDTSWKSVTAGEYHTVAIKNDSTLWAWGNNSYGQLGDGTTSSTNKNVPMQIGTDSSWKSATAGVYHTVAIKNDGTLWAWGNNYYGQLGDGSTTNKNIPTQIGIDTSWASVTAGEYHTVAIKSNATLWAWGNNSYGQLGDFSNYVPKFIIYAEDTNISSLIEIGISQEELENGLSNVSDGGTIKISSSGTIDLNRTITIDKNITIEATLYGSVVLNGDNSHQLFIIENGATVKLRGLIFQHGYGAPQTHGGAISNNGTLRIEKSLFRHNLVNYANGGAIYNNTSASLEIISSTFHDNNATDSTSLSVLNSTISGSGIFVNSSGGAIYSDGSLSLLNSTISTNSASAGGGIFVNSGDANISHSTIAYNIATNGGAIYNSQATLNMNNSIVTKNSSNIYGNLHSYGNNIIGSIDANFYATDVNGIEDVNVSDEVIYGLDTMSTLPVHPVVLSSFIVNKSNCLDLLGNIISVDELGISRTQTDGCDIGAVEHEDSVILTVQITNAPVDNWISKIFIIDSTGAETLLSATTTTVSYNQSYAVKLVLSDNSIWWYNFTDSKLYQIRASSADFFKTITTDTNSFTIDASSENWINTPIILTLDTNTSTLVAGGESSAWIQSNGTLWAWGYNAYGQLGDGTTTDKYVPTQIGTDTNWSSVNFGYYHNMAIKKDGTLWGWGDNSHGQLGDATHTNKLVPTKVGTDTNWARVVVGEHFTIALKNNGTLWAWGYNGYGQLGDGTTTTKLVPTQIQSDTTWTTINAGHSHAIGIKSDGTLWTWGYNDYGQLGDGTYTSKYIPTQIGTDTNWKSVEAGYYYTIAIKNNGTLWAWGYNGYGIAVGNGTYSTIVPTQIGTDINWKSITAGYYHRLAIKNDGTLWAWGNNSDGELGDGTTTDTYVPTQIGSDINWKTVSAGYKYTVALKTDETIWAWGNNSVGQFGDSTTNSNPFPKSILSKVVSVNFINVALSEHTITNIQLVGVDGNSENLSIPNSNNLSNGDNNLSAYIYSINQNFSVRVDTNDTTGNISSWYNFNDHKLHTVNDGSDAFKTAITSSGITIDALAENWIEDISDITPPTISTIYDRVKPINAESFTVSFNIDDDTQGDLRLEIINETNSLVSYTYSPSGIISYESYNTTPITLTITPNSAIEGVTSFFIQVTDESNNTTTQKFNVVLENSKIHTITSKEEQSIYDGISSLNVTNNLYSLNTWNEYNNESISQVVEYERYSIVSNVITEENIIKDTAGVVTHTTDITPVSNLTQTVKFETPLNNTATTALFSNNNMVFNFTDINATSQKMYVKYLSEELSIEDTFFVNGATYNSMDSFINDAIANNFSYGLLRNEDESKIVVLGSGNLSGNLLEVDVNTTILDYNIGSWQRKTVDGYDTLILTLTNNSYPQDSAFVVDNGVIKTASYKAAGDIYSYIFLNKTAKDELYHSISSNPKIEIPLNNGYTYISLPSAKTLCNEEIQQIQATCDQNNTLESIFGINNDIKKVFKFGKNWIFWDNNTARNPASLIQKFSTINPLEGILVKTKAETKISLPFDEDSEITNNFKNLFPEGWILMSNNKTQTVQQIATTLNAQNKSLVYIMLLRDDMWNVYAPTNNSVVDATMPRITEVKRYESFWAYFK